MSLSAPLPLHTTIPNFKPLSVPIRSRIISQTPNKQGIVNQLTIINATAMTKTVKWVNNVTTKQLKHRPNPPTILDLDAISITKNPESADLNNNKAADSNKIKKFFTDEYADVTGSLCIPPHGCPTVTRAGPIQYHNRFLERESKAKSVNSNKIQMSKPKRSSLKAAFLSQKQTDTKDTHKNKNNKTKNLNNGYPNFKVENTFPIVGQDQRQERGSRRGQRRFRSKQILQFSQIVDQLEPEFDPELEHELDSTNENESNSNINADFEGNGDTRAEIAPFNDEEDDGDWNCEYPNPEDTNNFESGTESCSGTVTGSGSGSACSDFDPEEQKQEQINNNYSPVTTTLDFNGAIMNAIETKLNEINKYHNCCQPLPMPIIAIIPTNVKGKAKTKASKNSSKNEQDSKVAQKYTSKILPDYSGNNNKTSQDMYKESDEQEPGSQEENCSSSEESENGGEHDTSKWKQTRQEEFDPKMSVKGIIKSIGEQNQDQQQHLQADGRNDNENPKITQNSNLNHPNKSQYELNLRNQREICKAILKCNNVRQQNQNKTDKPTTLDLALVLGYQDPRRQQKHHQNYSQPKSENDSQQQQQQQRPDSQYSPTFSDNLNVRQEQECITSLNQSSPHTDNDLKEPQTCISKPKSDRIRKKPKTITAHGMEWLQKEFPEHKFEKEECSADVNSNDTRNKNRLGAIHDNVADTQEFIEHDTDWEAGTKTVKEAVANDVRDNKTFNNRINECFPGLSTKIPLSATTNLSVPNQISYLQTIQTVATAHVSDLEPRLTPESEFQAHTVSKKQHSNDIDADGSTGIIVDTTTKNNNYRGSENYSQDQVHCFDSTKIPQNYAKPWTWSSSFAGTGFQNGRFKFQSSFRNASNNTGFTSPSESCSPNVFNEDKNKMSNRKILKPRLLPKSHLPTTTIKKYGKKSELTSMRFSNFSQVNSKVKVKTKPVAIMPEENQHGDHSILLATQTTTNPSIYSENKMKKSTTVTPALPTATACSPTRTFGTQVQSQSNFNQGITTNRFYVKSKIPRPIQGWSWSGQLGQNQISAQKPNNQSTLQGNRVPNVSSQPASNFQAQQPTVSHNSNTSSIQTDKPSIEVKNVPCANPNATLLRPIQQKFCGLSKKLAISSSRLSQAHTFRTKEKSSMENEHKSNMKGNDHFSVEFKSFSSKPTSTTELLYIYDNNGPGPASFDFDSDEASWNTKCFYDPDSNSVSQFKNQTTLSKKLAHQQAVHFARTGPEALPGKDVPQYLICESESGTRFQLEVCPLGENESDYQNIHQDNDIINYVNPIPPSVADQYHCQYLGQHGQSHGNFFGISPFASSPFSHWPGYYNNYNIHPCYKNVNEIDHLNNNYPMSHYMQTYAHHCSQSQECPMQIHSRGKTHCTSSSPVPNVGNTKTIRSAPFEDASTVCNKKSTSAKQQVYFELEDPLHSFPASNTNNCIANFSDNKTSQTLPFNNCVFQQTHENYDNCQEGIPFVESEAYSPNKFNPICRYPADFSTSNSSPSNSRSRKRRRKK